MTVTLSLPPTLEARLRDRAAAAGKDVSTFVREAVEAKLDAAGEIKPEDKSNEQWLAEFDAWMRDVAARAANYPKGYVVDDSRESIYEAGANECSPRYESSGPSGPTYPSSARHGTSSHHCPIATAAILVHRAPKPLRILGHLHASDYAGKWFGADDQASGGRTCPSQIFVHVNTRLAGDLFGVGTACRSL